MPVGFKNSVVADGSLIRRTREEKQLSQEALVALANDQFSLETLRRAERGARVSIEKLQAIHKQLGIGFPVYKLADIRNLVDLVPLEIPQATYVASICQALAYPETSEFKLFESTGDIDVDRSRITLPGGIKVKFRYEDLDKAQALLLRKLAQPLLSRGLIDTCWVVEGFKERWGKGDGELPPEAHIICVLEGLAGEIETASTDLIVSSLVQYTYDLPTDAERSFLNAIPSPSPTTALLHELFRREAWDSVRAVLRDSMSDIVIQWAWEIGRMRAGIQDKLMLEVVARGGDASPTKLWALNLLQEWVGLELTE